MITAISAITVGLQGKRDIGGAPGVDIGIRFTTWAGHWSKSMADEGSNLIVAMDFGTAEEEMRLARQLSPVGSPGQCLFADGGVRQGSREFRNPA